MWRENWIGRGCNGNGSGGGTHFCPNISSYMVLGSRIFRVGVGTLKELLGVLNCFIRCIK